ncbi:hypothetical protein BaRGS_00040072 [Batillaria attramentaria]|uniref:Uncharacterized protein n=1 Tax=Batillaria attramentaria TaxID=370345 RepID=A0ABD0J209_9CAEN
MFQLHKNDFCCMSAGVFNSQFDVIPDTSSTLSTKLIKPRYTYCQNTHSLTSPLGLCAALNAEVETPETDTISRKEFELVR